MQFYTLQINDCVVIAFVPMCTINAITQFPYCRQPFETSSNWSQVP